MSTPNEPLTPGADTQPEWRLHDHGGEVVYLTVHRRIDAVPEYRTPILEATIQTAAGEVFERVLLVESGIAYQLKSIVGRSAVAKVTTQEDAAGRTSYVFGEPSPTEVEDLAQALGLG